MSIRGKQVLIKKYPQVVRYHKNVFQTHKTIMAQTYYTQTIHSDGTGLALSSETVPGAPTVTYNCSHKVNINALFREVLFTDLESTGLSDSTEHKVRVVPSYVDAEAAKAASADARISDTAATQHLWFGQDPQPEPGYEGYHGAAVAMRFMNALCNKIGFDDVNEKDDISALIGGHDLGLLNGQTTESNGNNDSAATATMDLREFFQVGLAAAMNASSATGEDDSAKKLDIARRGLQDRERINAAAVNEDLENRSIKLDSVTQSDLLNTVLKSARQLGTLAPANGEIGPDVAVNWMKQLVYSIIVQSSVVGGWGSDEADERYQVLRRLEDDTGETQHYEQERFLGLKLKPDDSVVLVFCFKLTDDQGSVESTKWTNSAQEEKVVTVGFKVTHSVTTSPPASTPLVEVPVGWEVVA